MSLINCPECNNQISQNTKACPHCGNPNPNTWRGLRAIEKKSIIRNCIFALAYIFIMLAVYIWLSSFINVCDPDYPRAIRVLKSNFRLILYMVSILLGAFFYYYLILKTFNKSTKMIDSPKPTINYIQSIILIVLFAVGTYVLVRAFGNLSETIKSIREISSLSSFMDNNPYGKLITETSSSISETLFGFDMERCWRVERILSYELMLLEIANIVVLGRNLFVSALRLYRKRWFIDTSECNETK